MTDDSGEAFLFVPEVFGGLSLRVAADGYAIQCIQRAERGKETVVRLSRGSTVKGTIPRTSADPELRVCATLAPTGEFSPDRTYIWTTKPDADGSFELRNLPPETALLVYARGQRLTEGCVPDVARVTTGASESVTDAGDLPTAAGVRLAGRIGVDEGELPSNLSLVVVDPDTRQMWTIGAAPDGRWEAPPMRSAARLRVHPMLPRGWFIDAAIPNSDLSNFSCVLGTLNESVPNMQMMLTKTRPERPANRHDVMALRGVE